MLTKELKAAHATRLRFYKDKKLNATVELSQDAEHILHQFHVVSKILDTRYNEIEMFHELLVFCRPDQCSLTNSYVDDNSCLITE
jgi:hypothetical protein